MCPRCKHNRGTMHPTGEVKALSALSWRDQSFALQPIRLSTGLPCSLGRLSCILTTCPSLAFLMATKERGESPPSFTATWKVPSVTGQPACQDLQAHAFVNLWHGDNSSQLDKRCLRDGEPLHPHDPRIITVHVHCLSQEQPTCRLGMNEREEESLFPLATPYLAHLLDNGS